MAIAVYSLATIGFGYVGFRRSCVSALSAPAKLQAENPQTLDEQSDARKALVVREFESYSFRGDCFARNGNLVARREGLEQTGRAGASYVGTLLYF